MQIDTSKCLYIYIKDIQLQNIEVNEAKICLCIFKFLHLKIIYIYIYKQYIHQQI
jgi:hypothetical protein